MVPCGVLWARQACMSTFIDRENPVIDWYIFSQGILYQIKTHTPTQFGLVMVTIIVDSPLLPWVLFLPHHQHPWPQGHDVRATVVTASGLQQEQQERR